jgi:hypothetical protein
MKKKIVLEIQCREDKIRPALYDDEHILIAELKAYLTVRNISFVLKEVISHD